MAPTPAKSNQSQGTQIRTPQSKHRLNFNSAKNPHPSPNPNTAIKETPPAEHPVEVIGRIRDYPDRKDKPISALQLHSDHHSLRVRTDIGYRDFSLDGVSLSEDEDLDGFYKKFVQSRINGVKLGNKCTVMMYGPTGSGKSHTMFGCLKQPGIVYRSLRDILEGGDEESDLGGVGTYVQVSVLEIYNEEIYDLLSGNNGGGFSSLGWSKGSASKVKLEVMGGKAKNATSIMGSEAGKISKEIQKVEKRRIVKSTLCNERSSRSHCMIILDVPTVGGRLMLVDMAGSENIEQAGQIGFEAKMQTGKINQGNISLKRVVESIANGDSHVPFRDSKLTMLLQDSFEDDKSKILMILCASPDPKEMHKTISTLEYGAKAKCIIRGPHTPNDTQDSSSQVILGSRIAAMDQFIYKLQMENKLREKERNEAHKALLKKEEEVAALRAKLENVGVNEDEINMKVNERTQFLKRELEKKLQECQQMAEEKIRQQQEEVERLRQRLVEIESELSLSRGGTEDFQECEIAKRLMEFYAGEDPGMEKSMDLAKSMDLDMGDPEPFDHKFENFTKRPTLDTHSNHDQVLLSTVFEEEEAENEEEYKEKLIDEEVEKEIIEDKMVCSSSQGLKRDTGTFATASPRVYLPPLNPSCRNLDSSGMISQEASQLLKDEDSSSRRMRIQNIFTLCGNYRELSQQIRTPAKKEVESFEEDSSGKKFSREILQFQKSGGTISRQSTEILKKLEETQMSRIRKSNEIAVESKENHNPVSEINDSSSAEVYVKWETSKDNPGKFITKLKVVKNSSLADLRKLIEIQLGDAQAFNFLVLGDPSGAPVSKEKEAMVQVSKLPICNNQLNGLLVCLRPVKGVQRPNNSPFGGSLKNRLPLALNHGLHI